MTKRCTRVTRALFTFVSAAAVGCSSGKFGDDPATLMLVNDQGYLKLDGSPLDARYVQRYPNPTKVNVMLVEVLASNIGGAPVRIQLPELEVIRVRTTAAIPTK